MPIKSVLISNWWHFPSHDKRPTPQTFDKIMYCQALKFFGENWSPLKNFLTTPLYLCWKKVFIKQNPLLQPSCNKYPLFLLNAGFPCLPIMPFHVSLSVPRCEDYSFCWPLWGFRRVRSHRRTAQSVAAAKCLRVLALIDDTSLGVKQAYTNSLRG